MEAYVWLILILLGVVIEAITPQLISIWITLGCLCGLLAHFCGFTIPVQIIIAIAISFISLVFTRKFANKLLKNHNIATNADRNIGQIAIVIEDMNGLEKIGQIKINGVVWSAFTSFGVEISKGSKVMIKRIEGNKLFVEKVEG